MIIDVCKTFKDWSKLDCFDLNIELPGCEFDSIVNDIQYFRISNSNTLVDILTSFLGDYICDKNDTYHYKDGTICKFVKKYKWFEFKKYKKVFARIYIV